MIARAQPEADVSGTTINFDSAERQMIRTASLRMDQVVTNLFGNAIKYGAGKPVHLQLKVEGSKTVLKVTDHGIGVEPQHLKRIFERFERAVSERNYGGLGLGLYIVRNIVESLGGTIRVQSEEGRGATFTVELPTSGVNPQPPQPRQAIAARSN